MPVPTHMRFVVRGHFLDGEEGWSTSAHFSRDNPAGTDAGLDEVNEGDVTTAVTAFFGSSQFPSSCLVDDWRMYVIGTNGLMEGNGPKLHTYATPVPGTSTGYKYPNQVALCATLVAVNRGPAKYGRMFLPTPSVDLLTGGRISAGQAVNYATSLGAFLKAVSDAIDLGGPTSSAGLNVSPGPAGSTTGTKQEIDHIEVGRVLDTIRSRRRSLDEDRQTAGHLDW